MKSFLLTSISTFLCLFSFYEGSASGKSDLETYIVFLDKPEGLTSTQSVELHDWYTSFLPESSSLSSTHQDRMVHSYRSVITGFAAKLTSLEAKAMEQKEGFVSARVDRSLSLLTTYTPKFLGLQQNLGASGWKYSSNINLGKGVIIGIIDSGIKYDHPSFHDQGMPPPPARWKGKCDQFNGEKTCNNKLIGARSFVSSGNNITEEFFHGTHTAGEAAGTAVEGANVFGQATGTAMGIAPFSHLAMYKVCLGVVVIECFESSVLAAMDAAIEDGVDVLSLSLVDFSDHLYDDVIALGAFRAMQSGIFVSCSAGNEGPDASSVQNVAPWILTVGASTIDRDIRTTVTLGNNAQFHGQSLSQPKDFHPHQLPFVDPGGISGNASAAFCRRGSLKNIDVTGKIVLCEIGVGTRFDKGVEVKANGGVGMILINGFAQGFSTEPMAHVLPASHINYEDGLAIKVYLNSTSSPTATISFQGTVIGKQRAPQVALFSSRGPSKQTPGILKPDIIGPGVSILAAWGESVDNSTNSFNIVSGTSMSCPHLSGVAALIKAAHQDWSPSAIKSAILTTAYKFDLTGKPISNEEDNSPASVFDMGAGHVNPPKALDPGLIYDIQPDDYVGYLCGLGYSDTQVRMIVQRKVKCSNESAIPEAQLNYPTFSVSLGSSPQTYTTRVTNVGMPDSTYISKLVRPEGVDVKVAPSEMTFKKLKETATYSITFSRSVGNVVTNNVVGGQAGSLVWSSVDDRYEVASTIVVVFV